MNDSSVGKQDTDFIDHKMKPDESLWSVAYDHVLPPHSDPSVERCMNNIVSANDGSVYGKDRIKIPIPCDPKDAEELQKQQLQKDANALAKDFSRNNDPLDAAYKLSDQLVPKLGSLSTSNREYNYLIEKIYKQMENVPTDRGVHVGAEHWNKNTSTWDNLYLTDGDFPKSPPVRIVQPENTISSIAGDRIKQLSDMGYHVDSRRFVKEFMDLNGLESSKDLQVGRPVILPRTPFVKGVDY
jgi:hypothetical protein